MGSFDELLSLPEDPEMQFVEYEALRRAELRESLKGDLEIPVWKDIYIEYIQKVMAFHDAMGFDFLERPKIDRKSPHFDTVLDQFMDRVTYHSEKIKVNHSRRLRGISTVLCLNNDIKNKIHQYIQNIREAVQPVELKPAKKEAIFAKLDALAFEIDSDRTKAEALTALTLEIAGAGGQAAKKLEPVRKSIDSIANLFAKAKELGEQFGLPRPTIPKRIEPPRRQIAKQPEKDEAGFASEDEIPF